MSIQRSYDKRNFIFLKGQNCLTSSVPKNTFLSDYKFLNNEIKKEKKINLGLIHCQKSSYIPSLNKNTILILNQIMKYLNYQLESFL